VFSAVAQWLIVECGGLDARSSDLRPPWGVARADR
jgi:hypothetical protein